MARAPEKNRPQALPPEGDVAVMAGAGGAPTLDMPQAASLRGGAGAAPAMSPPVEMVEAGAEAGEQAVGAWHSSVKITSLWCDHSARNAWVGVEGLGWRKINPANESAFLNLTAILSHARQVNASCSLRVEADNLVHEAYVW